DYYCMLYMGSGIVFF
nr:immunoglobulin light chain junction region [Macaca mulatta]MOX77639.1 immunoglobulin light chain junction region [Macaca mulatta]MOX77984.1 immunoglobulin light chain junction region [Macaca mulatta]MOX78004.1 immunoglobulin light chain junction region [Macaca mulatta]MOX78381.1 immunoglobulin light chain junction region [Macaca mulatta]